MRQEQALIEIKKKFKEIVEIFQKNYSTEKYKIKTKADKCKLYCIEVVKKEKKNTSFPFVVRYQNDGKEIVLRSGKRNGAKVLVNFIKMVGIEKVYRLRIKAKRSVVLISDTLEGNEKNRPILVENKYIFTKSENDEKFRQIEEIINGLKIMDKASITIDDTINETNNK